MLRTRRSGDRLRLAWRLTLPGVGVWLLLITPIAAQGWNHHKQSLVALLEQRVQEQPGNASYWRMLGNAYARSGDHSLATAALRRALELDPQSAAAHFDLGISLAQVHDFTSAAQHLEQAISLAPQSEYASLAAQQLQRFPEPLRPAIQPASFEIDRFERSDRFPDLSVEPLPEPEEQLRRLSVRAETGMLFNTNATLAPTSRGLSAGEASSFQGIFNVDIAYLISNNEFWRIGPSLDGYFSVNEHPLRELNLQSYQPGIFFERSIYLETTELLPSAHYTYTLDAFDGNTFAKRHALNTTLATLWASGETTTGYWTIDHTDFADDGGIPEITSRDGWTNTLGAHHLRPLTFPFLSSWLIGSEVQWSDTVGSSFAYRGVSVYTEAELPIGEIAAMILEGGWGYRDYHRFTSTPSRNENIWSGGVRLEKLLTPSWKIAGVFRVDDFDSANDEFASQRIVTGIVTVFDY